MRIALSAAAFLLAVSSSAHASDPTEYVCDFKAGAAFAYEKGKFKPQKLGKVALTVVEIDADKQSAKLKSGASLIPVRVVRAVNALHFIEVVGEGFMNVTTVYDRDTGAARNPAVHSRHFGVLGQPVISQYRGTCAGK